MAEHTNAGAIDPRGKEAAALLAALPTPETIADPYPVYDRLRPLGPLFGYRDYPPGTVPGEDAPVEAWVLLSYNDVAAAARDHRGLSSRDPLQEQSSAPTLMLVNHDNPEHDALRKLIAMAFSPARVAQLEPWTRQIVAETFAGLPDGEIDGIERIAGVIPARVMIHLLGLPQGDFVRFKRWANAFMLSADLSPAERTASNAEVFGYFVETVTALDKARTEGKPLPDTLMTALLTAEIEGQRLSLDEVIRFCVTLVVAGAETTTYLIGNALRALSILPDVRQRLAADRALIEPFMDETLRLMGPPQRLFRVASEDMTIAGRAIKAGDWVAIFFGAANHDPDVFPNPRNFDLDRPNLNKQLSFGLGIHRCLGAPLARLEARAVIEEVLTNFEGIAPGTAAPVSQTASLLNHGFDHLPLVLRRPGKERAA
ncbi:MAG: cytochrome P450 [Alphaproteobacteria bacterium]|nr:cytochrome P450 [Alphaproteobacteria bacterium]